MMPNLSGNHTGGAHVVGNLGLAGTHTNPHIQRRTTGRGLDLPTIAIKIEFTRERNDYTLLYAKDSFFIFIFNKKISNFIRIMKAKIGVNC